MISPPPCYLDNNATTRVAPEVIEAMLPFLREYWGNPSSAYTFGHQLGEVIERARTQVAALVGAESREIVFTSCGTESIHTALHSALTAKPGKRHIVTTAVEHSATLKYCAFLEKQGYRVTRLPVRPDGSLDPARLEQAIDPDTALVSIMWANNETGLLFPVADLAAIAHARGALFHTDAVQAAGKLPVNVNELGVDFLSLSGHKLHAPKGVGALYIRQHTRFGPFVFGGGQERGRRSGTENVAGIVGFGCAAGLASAALDSAPARIRALRDRMERELLARIPGSQRNGPAEPRLPNTSNLAFEGVEAEGLLLLLDQAGVCASSGSACTTGSLDPSHVLVAMGLSPARARSSLRLSLGTYTTEADVDHVLNCLPGIVEKLREMLE